MTVIPSVACCHPERSEGSFGNRKDPSLTLGMTVLL
jgi:hypothetical protein